MLAARLLICAAHALAPVPDRAAAQIASAGPAVASSDPLARLQQNLADLEERIRLVTQREVAQREVMAKVMAAEEAMEACLTCMSCMGILKEPGTCTPCGHSFCASCLKAESGGGGAYMLAVCPECDGAAGKVVTVSALGTLASNFEFQKQQLGALQLGATQRQAAAASKLSNASKAKPGGSAPLIT